MAELNKACCALPPVTTVDYKPKGTWEKHADVNTYIVQPPTGTPKRAVIAVYDIFGPVPQTIQGCDRLAETADALVLLPDFFHGEALPVSLYPPDTEEKKMRVRDFMQKMADPDTNSGKLVEVAAAGKERWSGVKAWGAYGLCWGGKMVVLKSGAGTPFMASGQAHPGRLAKEDAENVSVPHICLFSKEDGAPEMVELYGEILKRGEDNRVEHFPTMPHGWMGARGFLSEESVGEFEKGYSQLASFFVKHLN